MIADNPPSIDQQSGTPQETVVTPAGRLPKDQVTHVRPGQSVRRNPDGTYTIIQERPPAKPEHEGPNDPQGR
jgi:hypothetical protein